ncbi:MAG: SDR family oxidoreductase [Bacteroidota bacterium]
MTYNLLKGKKGIVFGALNEHSIAWHVAEKAHAEGAELLLSNMPVALRVGTLGILAEKLGTIVIPADATLIPDLENLFAKAMEYFGSPVDFILHSIAMSPNVRKGRKYDDIDYDNFHKTLDVSALSLHKMLQVAKKAGALNTGASVVTISYIASQRAMPGYGDMAEAKAMLESIVRSFGYIYGKEQQVRINAVMQSPVQTPATSVVPGMAAIIDHSALTAPLGNAGADDCANACMALFSDLTSKITMQTIFNDGGFSAMAQ